MSARYIATPRGATLPLTAADAKALACKPVEEFHRAYSCIEAERQDVGYLQVLERFPAPLPPLHRFNPDQVRRIRRVELANIGLHDG